MRLFHLIQQESFPVETKCLLKQSPVSNSSKISKFSPFIEPQGLLRATGQTKQLAVSTFDSKHPILLDGRHPAVCLYWEQLHETHCHQSVDYLRTLVQQQFAIVKLRTSLRSFVPNVSLAANVERKLSTLLCQTFHGKDWHLKSVHLRTPELIILVRVT